MKKRVSGKLRDSGSAKTVPPKNYTVKALAPSPVQESSLTLTASDGYPLAATRFEPSPDNRRPAGIVIGSALGVPRYFYFKFARFLAENGFPVLTFDYRGIHESRVGNRMGSDMKMEDWGRQDIEAALKRMLEDGETGKLLYVGHSCGGQLVGLARSSERIDAMVFVAAQSGYWKHWDRPYRWGLWAVWQLLPALATVFDYLPTRLLGISSVDLPAGVARQWATWGKTPCYLFDPSHRIETDRYRRFRVPLLSFVIEDDPFYAPPASVEALLEEYPNADIERRHVAPSDYRQSRIGHFGFFRDKFKDTIWKEIVDWLRHAG